MNFGFGADSGKIVSGGNNSSNARPDLDLIYNARANKASPLWPVADSNHPLCLVATQGELAFNFKDTVDSETMFNMSRRQGRGRSLMDKALTAGYSETSDTVFYLTSLNGFGSENEVQIYGGKRNAQLSYRSKIDYLGVVLNSILKQHNLEDQGNTIGLAKFKETVWNTGKSILTQGMSVCWDVPLSDSDTYSTYGIPKAGVFEPNRMPLLIEPLPTMSSTVESMVETIADFRSPEHMESLMRFHNGIMKASIAYDVQLGSIGDIENADYETLAKNWSKSNPNSWTNEMQKVDLDQIVRTKALISIDEEDLPSLDLFSQQNISKPLDSIKKRAAAKNYAYAKNPDRLRFLNTSQTGKDVYSKIAENGYYDVVIGVLGLLRSGFERKIGKAVTDCSPGNKFDLVNTEDGAM